MIKFNSINAYSKSASIALLGFLISMGITFVLWFNAHEKAQNDAEKSFEDFSAKTTLEIKNRMLAYENVLHGGAALLNTVEHMNRKKWHIYVESSNVVQMYPGFQGIGVSEVIPADDLMYHFKKMRADGFEDYQIKPSGKRDEYHTVVYLEPLDAKNRRAIGYDMYTNPVRKQAMVRARDTGTAALSDKVTLVQEQGIDKQAGFLLYIPFYHMENTPKTKIQRRADIKGFVFAPFRTRDLMNEILQQKNGDIAMQLYDGSVDEKNLLYTRGTITSKPLFKKTVPIEMYGRTWIAVFQTLPSFEESIDYKESYLILLSGFPISFLLLLSIFFYSQTTERARRMAYKMTAEIRALNHELETIIETAPNPIILHTEDGTIVKINKAWSDSSGYSLSDIPTTDIWVAKTYKDDHKKVKEHIHSLFSITEKVDEGEFSFFSKSGAKITWQFSSAPFGMLNGKRAVITSAMDVTELKNKDDMMMMQSRHAAMGEMINMIAHQWRQPLASIAAISGILNLEAMMDQYNQEYFMEKLDLISNLSIELSDTINDFRNFFKEDKQQELMTWKEIANGSLTIIEPILKAKNITLHTRVEDDALFMVYPREIRQVILNILKNAEDVLTDNMISEPQIWIQTLHDENMSCLEIEDNGGGIPEELINKIFDPYFSTKMEKNGTGIGLYMSKTIVEQHGKGRLTVHNTARGACFQILFPIYR